jgi:hypothetical protein
MCRFAGKTRDFKKSFGYAPEQLTATVLQRVGEQPHGRRHTDADGAPIDREACTYGAADSQDVDLELLTRPQTHTIASRLKIIDNR